MAAVFVREVPELRDIAVVPPAPFKSTVAPLDLSLVTVPLFNKRDVRDAVLPISIAP